MDLFDVLLQAGLFTALVATYLIFVRKQKKKYKNYREPGWNFPLKLLVAKYVVNRWRAQLPTSPLNELPHVDQNQGWDGISLKTSAPNGSTILLGIRKLCGRKPIAEVIVYVKLADGTTYSLPQHPETAVGMWSNTEDGWCAGGLKIQVLEPKERLRILYNGLLTRVEDNVTQHVTLNLLWASATSVVRHPEDWSSHLAAQTLALEPWRDTSWPQMLNKCDEGAGNWLQWGIIQGRFQSYDLEGGIDRSEYLRTRGVRERHWARGYKHLRRSIVLTASARDGTAVQIRAHSYKKNFTQCVSGSIRFPNFMIKSISHSDLVMSDFGETADEIPKTYTVNVGAMDRSLKLVLRIHEGGCRFKSGFPHQQEIVLRTFSVDISGHHGTGVVEFGYESKDKLEPNVHLTPLPLLKWLTMTEAGDVGYCLPFEDRAATCPDYVGGKGASLALLASLQKEEGYRVPPGFCLTIKAMEKHIELNPELNKAIGEIEAANENYNEENFKNKCAKAVNLFMMTEIEGDVKNAILTHLGELTKQAIEVGLGPEPRFAVRSSAVGEDSEALSAAGQNATELGGAGGGVLRAVLRCWASMFAFTSASYRRQNGQAARCGGGVVVQALVRARAAGVLFSRHPAGDPRRLLLTANYGLGESVVSGSVEPDTITVKRGLDGKLDILKIEVGSKTHRVITSEEGVDTVDVPEGDREKPCLSETEILRLAQAGVAQEQLWGAGRDIEWAITDDHMYLLQARPITSLERWTEEELLHELDFPIMSDDELLTFANTGEVLPKPMTALSHDLIYRPLDRGMSPLMPTNDDGYDKSTVITHNRCAIALYNTVYRRVSKEIDVNIRMIEMSIHGHKVADDDILSTALHRRPPQALDKVYAMMDMIKNLLRSGRTVNKMIKDVNIFHVDATGDDTVALFEAIAAAEADMTRFMGYHAITSTASAFTNFLTMIILLEGRSDFSPEECAEVCALLSSGDVLSAEVPQILGKLARKLEQSGKLEEFRAQDPKFALTWLKYNLPHVHNDVIDFLETHGHRAIMEFDLATEPWVLVPEEFMSLLMQVQPTKEEKQDTKTINDIISSLKTPQKSSTKRVLRWVVPLCRRAVRQRESTKAHLTRAVHKLRLAARALARRMAARALLPHPRLLCHFRLAELRRYLHTRDPALLRKAVQRDQYFPKWCKLKFAELHKGWVEPLRAAKAAQAARGGGVRLAGTAVCAGDVVARACVVKDLAEIGELHQGDILITHSTDIGWSPYFPLLSGIVTELGGLISHGAVIAREYGLPCIVGATNATDLFKTGDMVQLIGSNGILEKVSLSEN